MYAARVFTSPRAAVTVALLAGIEIQSIMYANLILTDLFGMAAGALCVVGLVWYASRPNIAQALICGASFALVGAVRPSCMYLWIVAGVMVLGKSGLKLSCMVRTAAHLLIVVTLALAPILAWSARNYCKSDQWFYSTTPEIALVNWQLARLLMEVEGVTQREARADLAAMLHVNDTWEALSDHPNPAARARVKSLALELIGAQPFVFAKLYMLGVARVMIQPDNSISLPFGVSAPETGLAVGTTGIWDAITTRWNALGAFLSILYLSHFLSVVVLWTLGAMGLWLGLRQARLRPAMLALAMMVALVVLTAGGYPGDPRYRLPAIPALVLLGGPAIERIFGRTALKKDLEYRKTMVGPGIP